MHFGQRGSADHEARGHGLDATAPQLLEAGKVQPGKLVTHRFGLSDTMRAYDTFADAAKAAALKVVLKG